METRNVIDSDSFFENKVLGHPAGLFVLFFTEMWERFSYYGMRAILVLFLTSAFVDGGWAWPRENALALYGTYTSLVYLTTMLGGWLADNIFGYRKTILLGAFLMTLGHASMAVETEGFIYLGLLLLVFGVGIFKPNMTSIVSQMYKDFPEKKDGAFTIFYMGVNSGAFLGIMLCGYLGEKVSWSYGFGLAGIFMFFGLIMFYLSQGIFGNVGVDPLGKVVVSPSDEVNDSDKRNPFTILDKVLISIAALIGIVWIINDPVSKIYKSNIFGTSENSNYAIIFGVILFLFILLSRIVRYNPITRDRMYAVVIIAFVYMLFWASFEQAGGSMTIFASSYTNRTLDGSWSTIFKVCNTLLTIIPLGILTWVLLKLIQATYKKYSSSNVAISISFVIVWGIVIWMLNREFNAANADIPASWFQILNSFFIISLAPLFTKLWESKYNPPAAYKYALGMVLLGIGFLALAYGSNGIPQGAKSASVSIIWLIIAYLFHTMGELCISPIGLSYVSKLVPGRMISMMFGVWYLAIAIGNKTAGTMGGMIDSIVEKYSMSSFFLIFTIVPFVIAVLIAFCNPLLKRLMHGVK
jgi:POT family proton-dependent oligopeptide transporter